MSAIADETAPHRGYSRPPGDGGRPTKVGRESARSAASIRSADRDQRRRRPPRPAPRLRRLQPDVAFDRRARADRRRCRRRPRRPSSTAGDSARIASDWSRRASAAGASLFGTGVSRASSSCSASSSPAFAIGSTRSRSARRLPRWATRARHGDGGGFGRPIDDPELQRMTAEGTAVFAKRWPWWPTRSASSSTTWVRGRARQDDGGPRSRLGQIAAGCVADVAASWQGRGGGRTVVELNVRGKKAPIFEPDLADRGRAGHRGAGDVRPCGRPCSSSCRRTSKPIARATSWCWVTS